MILLACTIDSQDPPLALNLDHMLRAEPFGDKNKPLTQITMVDREWHLLSLPFADFISILRIKGNQHFYDARPKEANNDPTIK